MKNITLILAFLFLSLACNQIKDSEEIQLTIHHFDCENTKYSLNINIQNDYTIIRSKEIYDSKVTGDCHPTIDFSLFDLVIGRQSSGNENDTIKYDLWRTCPGNELILTVDIIQSGATRPDNVVFHALIPKLGNEETLKVKINVK
jgi:hypothetical protein